jgi:pimeloyl-ACP methyl ester carboxylesterase
VAAPVIKLALRLSRATVFVFPGTPIYLVSFAFYFVALLAAVWRVSSCVRRLTELSVVPDCGHLITSEQPQAAAAIVNKVFAL